MIFLTNGNNAINLQQMEIMQKNLAYRMAIGTVAHIFRLYENTYFISER